MNAKEFNVGDLVLRKNMDSMVNPTHGKLGANCEGPYVVGGATGTGAYYLRDQEDRDISNLWNISNMRKYYH